ncbi:protein ALP1-like [Setaria viridis]|uniref:protein ALP1-like n=1 Tax=Setaria viridis TaxID=4556 RepID=UPI001493553B|nr:protein ALP1-like [Setaria viridis]
MEALGMFLWIIGSPQSLRQVEDRFVRSLETISRTFDNVLSSVLKLAVQIISPKDPEFENVHRRLQNPRFALYFNNCIGAIDGTHVPVVVPSQKVVQYTGRHGYTTQNVLAICDFDMRFTFVVSGWPGSVHDMRVFNDAVNKYGDKFPHPPPELVNGLRLLKDDKECSYMLQCIPNGADGGVAYVYVEVVHENLE